MATDSWDVLGFPQVREYLVVYCRTPMGAERVRLLRPLATREAADDELDRLAEVVGLDTEPELGPVDDIRSLLERARTGGVLTGSELLIVGRTSGALTTCRCFLDRHRGAMVLTAPELDAIDGDESLSAEIGFALDETGSVVDAASAELATTRRDLRSLRGSVVRRLETMMAEHPDRYGERPTIRHDRHVVPLRVEHRDSLSGVVHESSATGQTVFVEPMAVVKDQNRLEELRGREQEEVARILRALSVRVAAAAGTLARALECVGRLDFLLAGRRFADEFSCTRPELTVRSVRISAGRHPLLVKSVGTAVPLDLVLPEEVNVLLISGPNAGGKTVVLKTLGLFCLLAACGLFVPAGDGTQLPFYRQVFADIGDDQSLDASLSSFTAHVVKLRNLLERVDSESLVLLDEVGASTSPEEGSALAIAVLEVLHERGVRVLATSHFWTLKLYVQDRPEMLNAAMGIEGSRPTYQLMLGLPGESSAFEIAAVAGLPVGLLDRARQHVGQEWVDLAGRLRELERELERARTARVEIERQLVAASRMKADYEERLRAIECEQERQQERYVVRQRRMLLEARREIENLVREIRESQASHDVIAKAKRVVEERLRQLQVDVAAPGSVPSRGSEVLLPGAAVESRTLRRRGRVIAIEGNEVVVAVGRLRMILPVEDLSPSEAEDAAAGVVQTQDCPDLPAKLNVLGHTRLEAVERVEGYLAEASAVGRTQVRVLHGKGEGVLQQAIWVALRRNSRVARFRFAELSEGGTGVTIVDLKTGQQ